MTMKLPARYPSRRLYHPFSTDPLRKRAVLSPETSPPDPVAQEMQERNEDRAPAR
ncbi:uncharacterized protein DNG_05757 [Cephalotrichum gorgonifer]|uniref:Uncharacterized protein n=1 Tax=Cephalotrichum gorgonifer TaxID=2041049 RepID=A0AAE8SVS2_9PEZI|nr:uncharacterized protein DNG_05757 [Cephalotrichum gorgonifer]